MNGKVADEITSTCDGIKRFLIAELSVVGECLCGTPEELDRVMDVAGKQLAACRIGEPNSDIRHVVLNFAITFKGLAQVRYVRFVFIPQQFTHPNNNRALKTLFREQLGGLSQANARLRPGVTRAKTIFFHVVERRDEHARRSLLAFNDALRAAQTTNEEAADFKRHLVQHPTGHGMFQTLIGNMNRHLDGILAQIPPPPPPPPQQQQQQQRSPRFHPVTQARADLQEFATRFDGLASGYNTMCDFQETCAMFENINEPGGSQ
ncbi:hypothetical protein H9P43_003442 [Blastocladiella emersonii ATCC 22665]|nr:hypothetical protein H9P43_003442 [Blastocladiella emersonii ATCC 22665]